MQRPVRLYWTGFVFLLILTGSRLKGSYANHKDCLCGHGERRRRECREIHSGFYRTQPWSSELAIVSWYGKLAVLDLPSENPNSFTTLRHVGKDTFERVRTGGKAGEK